LENSADRAPDPVWSALGPLGKDANFGPVFIVPRVTGSSYHTRGIDTIEDEEHLDMRKVVDALKRRWRESVGENNAGFFATPEVVVKMFALRFDVTDRLYFEFHLPTPRRSSMLAASNCPRGHFD
jgi:hypothetical protein